MTTVLLGTNLFEDCESLIAVAGDVVLSVGTDPVEVTLVLPAGARRPLVLRRNRLLEGDANLEVRPQEVLLFTDENQLVLSASQIRREQVMVHLDLRPFGLLVYTDTAGLHVGNSVIAGNKITSVKNAVALG